MTLEEQTQIYYCLSVLQTKTTRCKSNRATLNKKKPPCCFSALFEYRFLAKNFLAVLSFDRKRRARWLHIEHMTHYCRISGGHDSHERHEEELSHNLPKFSTNSTMRYEKNRNNPRRSQCPCCVEHTWAGVRAAASVATGIAVTEASAVAA